jgi:tRNA pseudouridine-54 N-methylase
VVEQPISRGSVCMLTGSTVLRCQCMYADGSTVLRCQVRERTAAAARVRALKADVEAQREKEKGLQYQFEVLQQARENNVVSA